MLYQIEHQKDIANTRKVYVRTTTTTTTTANDCKCNENDTQIGSTEEKKNETWLPIKSVCPLRAWGGRETEVKC